MTTVRLFVRSQDSVTSIDVTDHEILVGCADGRARRYDLRNGQLLTDYVGAQITSVSFTKDGQCLLVGTSDDTVRLFDKSTGEMLQEYTGHKHSKYRIDSVMDKSDQGSFGAKHETEGVTVNYVVPLPRSVTRELHGIFFSH